MPRVEAVTADDVRLAVRLAIAALREMPPPAWDARTESLEWTRWETVEHLLDDLVSYAARLAPEPPPLDGRVPFRRVSRRDGGPAGTVHADREAGPAGLLQALDASAGMLAAMVRCSSPDVRAYHVYGASDPEGFAAMGVVETLVHTHDIVEGLGLPWDPPAGLCSRALGRLFPDVPRDTEPWPTLLWATGRGELPGRPRLTSWRWDGTVRA